MCDCRENTSSYLYLDSDDRLNKVLMDMTNVSFPVNFKANASVYLALSSYDFVYAINNINNNNNTAFIDTSTQSFQITLPNGNYSFTALATVIQTALNVAIPGCTCSFGNGVYTITSPSDIRFLTNAFNPRSRDWGDMITMVKSPPIRSMTLIGGIPDISYTNKIYIICEAINRFKDKSDESSSSTINDCLGVVYVNPNIQMQVIGGPDTALQHHATRDIHNLKWIKHRSRYDLGPINITLLDDRGMPLPSDQLDKIRWSIEVLVR